jgi:site-specific DNA-methyltransferase (adenine-specific)
MSTPYYADGAATLWHGDCREITAWLDADVLVTDPPYGIAWRYGVNKRRSSFGHDGIVNDEDTTVRDEALAMWHTRRPGVVFGTWAAPFPANVQVLVWRKPIDAGVVGSVTGFRRDTELIFLIGRWPRQDARRSSVLVTNSNKNAYLRPGQHPHAKPVGLMETILEFTPAGVIADPFVGSGATLIAARNLGRRAVGVELDERYCEIAARRLAQGILTPAGEQP